MGMVTFTYMDLFNIPAIILLGVVTSRQDLKEGKIRNKWILISLLYSFLTLGVVALILRLEGTVINPVYVSMFFSNLAISLVFGVFLWLSKLWSAGDAKLFVAYAALIPISTYRWQAAALFPSYVLLINTFTPIFVYFLARIITRIKPDALFRELRNSLNPKIIGSFALFIFGFSFVGSLLFRLTGIEPDFAVYMLFLFLLLIFLKNTLKADLMKVSIAFAVLRLVLDFRQMISWQFWLSFGLQLMVFLLAQYFVINLGSKAFARQIYVEDLKPGMCLVHDVVEEKGKLKHSMTSSYSFLQSMVYAFDSSKSAVSDYSCLSPEDVEKLKKSHSGGKLKEHIVLIYDKISFAIFMFAGAVATLIAQGDMIVAIRIALERFI